MRRVTRAWRRELPIPEGYTLLQYLQKNVSGQAIDTGLYIQDRYQVVMKAQFPVSTSNDTWLAGHWASSKDFLIGYYGGIKTQCGKDTSTYYSTVISNDMKPHLLGILKDKFVVDDIPQTTYPDYGNTAPSKLYLFKSNHVDNATARRIYWCQIKDWNDDMVREYLPCLDAAGVPCMYDTVSERTYYATTGTFVAGDAAEEAPVMYWS